MPLLRDPRPRTASDGNSPASSVGTKRRFPLLGRKKTKTSELPRPTTALPSPSAKKGLRVHIQVKFEKPLNGADHTRDYEGSPKLTVSDRICQALLSRLQHCSAELITRHDCHALDPLQKPHRDAKPLRYRINYRVERDGLCLVDKSLRSFQEYELTSDDAREVVAATDRIVGLFLLRHDPGFRWSEVSEPEPFNVETETVRPCTGRPQSTFCIPRSRFVNATQTFQLIPGYSIELFLRSRCATRYPENRNAAIKIDSTQPTPLTLLAGEDLTTRVCNLLDDPVYTWKRKFDKKHKSCNGLEGTNGCTHVEDGAVDIMIKVRNNLGPDYNYFSHRIQTSKVLFSDPQGRDFDEFANQLKAKMEKARDLSDQSLRSMDDLTLKIRALRGKGFEVHEPLTFRLDPSVTYCRQTIDAIIERLQAGISNVLEGHEDALATMTAHKRGHLIYDGFLDGAGGADDIPFEKFASPDLERRVLEKQLKDRISTDITMLCKDTCALDCTDRLPNLKVKGGGDSRPSIGSIARPASDLSMTTTTESAVSIRSDHTLSKKQAKQNLRADSQVSLGSADLTRVPSGVEAAKRHGYMADYIADDENQSEPPSTPSLVDTDGISPHTSVLTTPQSSRNIPEDHSNHGLRIIDDGKRIIYQERSDADEIAQGVTNIHHFEEEDMEPIQLTKDRPIDTLSEKPTRRSFDTRMPDLSGNHTPVPTETPREEALSTPRLEEPTTAGIAGNKAIETPTKETELTLRQEEKPKELLVPESTTEILPQEGVLEYTCQPESSVSPEETPVTELPHKTQETSSQDTPIVAPTISQPVDVKAEQSLVKESVELSQDDTWEMVEASNAIGAIPALNDLPREVEASTKSETSFERNTTEPVVPEGVKGTEPVVESSDSLETPRAESIKDGILIKEPVEQLKDEAIPEIKTPDENTPSSESVRGAKEANVVEDKAKDIALDDFPKPPKSERSFTEESHHEVAPKEAKDGAQRIHLQATEKSVTRTSEDSAIDLEEQPPVPVKDEKEIFQQDDKPALPSSEDSGIFMGEHSQQAVSHETDESEAAVAKKEPTFEEEIPEAVKAPAQDFKVQEISTAVPAVSLDDLPKTVTPKTIDFVPTVAVPDVVPVVAVEPVQAEEEPKFNERTAPVEPAQVHEITGEEHVVDGPVTPAPEASVVPAKENEPEVPEVMASQVEVPIPESNDVVEQLTSAATEISEPRTPIKDGPIAPAFDSYNGMTPLGIASAPLFGAIPEESLSIKDEANSYFPQAEKSQRALQPSFSEIDIPKVITRPRRSTMMDRPKSTALTLQIYSDPADDPEDGSPVDARPTSAVGSSPRRYFQHHRQPSAGLLGFHEQRLMTVGLRNALPYHYRRFGGSPASESRPGTSYSEQ